MDEKPTLAGVSIWGIRIAVEPESRLKDYLCASMDAGRHLKIAPITMGVLWRIFLFPGWKKRYRCFDLVYPESRFAYRTLSFFNPHLQKKDSRGQGEKMIYSHRLLLDLMADIFQKQRALTFIGLNENQKNNLQRKIKFLFDQTGDICFLHSDITRNRPQETLTWLNRDNYGLVVIDPKAGKARQLALQQGEKGLLLFDRAELRRYRKEWKRPSSLLSMRGIALIISTVSRSFLSVFLLLLGILTLFYPLQGVFSLSFWWFSFIINRFPTGRFSKSRTIIVIT